jgi:hypothetical protein
MKAKPAITVRAHELSQFSRVLDLNTVAVLKETAHNEFAAWKLIDSMTVGSSRTINGHKIIRRSLGGYEIIDGMEHCRIPLPGSRPSESWISADDAATHIIP